MEFRNLARKPKKTTKFSCTSTLLYSILVQYNSSTRVKLSLQLRSLGHAVDKVEIILMGGTFMCLPADYRDYFIRSLHDALSGAHSANVGQAVKYEIRNNRHSERITVVRTVQFHVY